MATAPKRKILFILTGDPRSSGKPAEAIRIAAGVGAWEQAEFSLYLRGPAVLALSEFPDEFIDADNYTRYLPMIAEASRPIYAEQHAPFLAELGKPALPFQEISNQQLAELTAQSHYVASF